MAAKSTTYETDILELVLNNVGVSLVGDATGILPSATNGSLYVRLHTADPGAGGNQSTSEAAYTGYAAVAVARSSSSKQWTVTSGSATNANAITFGQCTAGSSTITYASIGTAATGSGKLLYRCALSSSLAVSTTSNQIPVIQAGAATITEN